MDEEVGSFITTADNDITISTPSFLSARQQLDMRVLDDDWSGTTDPMKRRKLQNRLHQRAWRRRQATQRKLRVVANNANAQPETSQPETSQPSNPSPDATSSNTSELSIVPMFCFGNVDEAHQSLARFGNYAYAQYLQGSPRTDLLLTLIKFNVFRALMANDQTLGFDNQWLRCEAESPFCDSKTNTLGILQNYPPNLMPTCLQLTVTHHPWIDLLPDPRMRDNILLHGDGYDDEPLCHDIVDDRHGKQIDSLIVWGDPCDLDSWEIGENFYQKWASIVQGCHQLFRATNKWRTRRGEPKLFSDTLCNG